MAFVKTRGYILNLLANVTTRERDGDFEPLQGEDISLMMCLLA